MVNWQAASDMLVAIRNKDEKRLEEIIASGDADCDQRFTFGGVLKPAVLLCIERGCYDIAKRLLKLGCSVNQGDSDGNTPLHVAVRYGDITFVEMLLSHGADPNRLSCSARNHAGVTPVHVAIAVGKIEVLQLLLAHGGDPNKPDSDIRLTPLLHASLTYELPNKYDVVELLLAAGAQVPTSRIRAPLVDYDPDLALFLEDTAKEGPMSLKQWCRRAIVKRPAVRAAAIPLLPKPLKSFLQFKRNH